MNASEPLPSHAEMTEQFTELNALNQLLSHIKAGAPGAVTAPDQIGFGYRLEDKRFVFPEMKATVADAVLTWLKEVLPPEAHAEDVTAKPTEKSLGLAAKVKHNYLHVRKNLEIPADFLAREGVAAQLSSPEALARLNETLKQATIQRDTPQVAGYTYF